MVKNVTFLGDRQILWYYLSRHISDHYAQQFKNDAFRSENCLTIYEYSILLADQTILKRLKIG